MPPAAPTATNSAQAMSNLQSFTGNMQSPEASLQHQEQQLGVQADQGQVQGLQGAIANTNHVLSQVAPSVMGRTANSLVTSAQADKQITNEQAPLNTQLNQENQDYGVANTAYTNALGQAESLAQADQTAQTNKAGYLQNIYNNLYTQEQNKAASDAAAAAAATQNSQFQQTLAAQQAQAAAASRAAASTPQLVGGGSASQGFAPGKGFNMGTNSGGGLSFTGANGKPVTAGQYVASGGGGVAQLAQVLGQSRDPGDQQILAQLNNGTPIATLRAKYPYVFGGV